MPVDHSYVLQNEINCLQLLRQQVKENEGKNRRDDHLSNEENTMNMNTLYDNSLADIDGEIDRVLVDGGTSSSDFEELVAERPQHPPHPSSKDYNDEQEGLECPYTVFVASNPSNTSIEERLKRARDLRRILEHRVLMSSFDSTKVELEDGEACLPGPSVASSTSRFLMSIAMTVALVSTLFVSFIAVKVTLYGRAGVNGHGEHDNASNLSSKIIPFDSHDVTPFLISMTVRDDVHAIEVYRGMLYDIPLESPFDITGSEMCVIDRGQIDNGDDALRIEYFDPSPPVMLSTVPWRMMISLLKTT